MAVSKNELRNETRNWFERGVIPEDAAKWRREAAEQVETEEAKEFHLACAAKWDRVIETQKDKIIESYERVLFYQTSCLAKQAPGSELAKYWQDRVAETDRKLLKLDPSRER